MKEKEVEKASLKYVHCGKAEGRDFEWGHHKKLVRLSRRREMAKQEVSEFYISTKLACAIFIEELRNTIDPNTQ
jgi:hypothetical protein